MTIEVEKNVVIGSGGARNIHGDIYQPSKGMENGAGVLMIHGGGWSTGTKEQVSGQAEVLSQHGFTCLACEYRLTPEAPWPAQIHDVKTAIRWFRANAGQLGCRPDRIAALGNSAGGHLALLLAGTVDNDKFEGEGAYVGVDTSVAAVIAVYPAVSFYVGERTSGSTPATSILGDQETSDVAVEISPITYVSADFPPTFFLHGNGDKVVPVSASMNMYNALARAGAKAEMHIYAEQPHSWVRWPHWVGPTMREAAVFLERYLVDRGKYQVEGS